MKPVELPYTEPTDSQMATADTAEAQEQQHQTHTDRQTDIGYWPERTSL